MDPIELFTKEGKSAGVFVCSKCKMIRGRGQLEDAKECCNWKCSDCGTEVGRYSTRCGPCRRAESARRDAEILANADVVEDWDGPVYSGYGGNDGYNSTMDDLLDYLADEEVEDRPEFVHCCTVETLTADLEDVTSRLCDQGWEDMLEHADGMKELDAAIDAFNEANKDIFQVWHVDYKRKVLVPSVLPREQGETS